MSQEKSKKENNERGGQEDNEGINITLNKKYTITSDIRCYTLNQILINKKTNQSYLKPIGYYGSLENLFQGLYSREIRIKNATTIEELLHNVIEVKKEIHSIMKKVDKLLG